MTIEQQLDDVLEAVAALHREVQRISAPIPRKSYKIPEVAVACGVSTPVVYGWIRSGDLPTVTLPGMKDQRVPAAAVDALLAPDRWNRPPDSEVPVLGLVSSTG